MSTTYLLSYSGPAVAQFIKKHAKARRFKQQVVRWGNNWGFIQQSPNWDAVWQAEERVQVAEHESGEERFLLERATPSTLQAPPLLLDDMWSEEVIFDRHIKAGNLLYIRGSLSEILDTAKQLGVLTTTWLEGQI